MLDRQRKTFEGGRERRMEGRKKPDAQTFEAKRTGEGK